MDEALLLARAQFGLNIGFHILFPSLTIALAWYLVAFRIAYQRTRDAMWLATYQLWVKIFALSFAMGVVSGVTMTDLGADRSAPTGATGFARLTISRSGTCSAWCRNVYGVGQGCMARI